jgi:hypothetical protein
MQTPEHRQHQLELDECNSELRGLNSGALGCTGVHIKWDRQLTRNVGLQHSTKAPCLFSRQHRRRIGSESDSLLVFFSFFLVPLITFFCFTSDGESVKPNRGIDPKSIASTHKRHKPHHLFFV